MTPRDQRLAEAVREACAAAFSTRADNLRATVLAGDLGAKERRRVVAIVRALDANAAFLRALDVSAAVATIG